MIKSGLLLLCALTAPAQDADKEFFPIAVWLQNPGNAKRYAELGINTYVGLYRGPTDQQLDQLKAAGMNVVCHANEVALKRKDDPSILAWMHGDEPDNAQARRGGGYGPPIAPAKIVADYRRLKERDPSRPVFLNLGQGVAWDGWGGRGVRTNHPEDYPEYIKGCDIASFDIYPAVHSHPKIAGQLWYVARGVERLKKWAGPERRIWNCIEASRISNVNTRPTPAQIRTEVWMSIIHGSRGLIYFVHQFKPRFVEASLLRDEELREAVKSINREVASLAPVINAPPVEGTLRVRSSDPEVPVASMVRRHDGSLYLFAVAMRGKAVTAKIEAGSEFAGKTLEDLTDKRTIPYRDGGFQDRLPGYGVRLYRVR